MLFTADPCRHSKRGRRNEVGLLSVLHWALTERSGFCILCFKPRHWVYIYILHTFVVQVIPLVCLITVQVSSAHAHAPNQYELASEFSSAESSTSASSTVLGRPEESASGDLSWNCGECCYLHRRSRFVASQFHSQQATITMQSMHTSICIGYDVEPSWRFPLIAIWEFMQ